MNGESQFEIWTDEIPLFLDILPYASIVINFRKRTIFAVNGLVTDLTKFGRQDLVGLKISSLIEKYPTNDVIEGKEYNGSIKVKDKLCVPISFKIHFLSKKSDIAVIQILEGNIANSKSISSELSILESLVRINKIAFTGDEQGFFMRIISEITGLFQFTKAYIYLSDNREGSLLNIKSEDGIFPKRIPTIEMERIKKIDYWSPGKRVLTEIHRIGRKNGFSNVISAPLGDPQIGLLILISTFSEINIKRQRILEKYISQMDQFLRLIKEQNKNSKDKNRLTENNLLFSRLIELSNDCAILVDEDFKIIFLNQQSLKLLGYSSYELIGQNFLDIIQADQLKSIINKKTHQLREIPPIFIHDRAGTRIPVKMKILKSDINETEKYSIIFSDISEEINTETTIKRIENQAALGEDIAKFAHEVRNPINNISTGLQLMRKKLNGDESSLEIVDRLQSDCVRINDLMESILSFSRQNVSTFKAFNCFELLSRINNRFSTKYQKFKINSILICNTEKVIIYGDIRSIDQIFTNLINNAIDAMKINGGELAIKLDNCLGSDNLLQITISDTGRGIPDELKKKIFDPFISGKASGTGLGLSITKKIIEAHKGTIKVDSFTTGTIFTVLLKLAEEE